MDTPQVEIELDGARQPLPGRLKRLTVTEDSEWAIAVGGHYGLYRRERDVRIEVWALAVESRTLERFVEQSYPRLWVTQPGAAPISVIITDSMRNFGSAGSTIELRGRTPGREFAAERTP